MNSLLQPNKKMLTGFSIETPDCPPNPNLHRGKVPTYALPSDPMTPMCLYIRFITVAG